MKLTATLRSVNTAIVGSWFPPEVGYQACFKAEIDGREKKG